MEEINRTQTPVEMHKPHKGLFVLLILAIVLLLGIFGIFVYGAFFQEKVEPAPSTLEQAVEDAKIDDLVVDEELVKEEKVTSLDVKHFSALYLPEFDYPVGAHISTQISPNNVFGPVTYVSSEPIFNCGDCGRPPANISIKVLENIDDIYDPVETFKVEHASEAFSEPVIKKLEDGSTFITTTYKGSEGFQSYNIEAITFKTTMYSITAVYENLYADDAKIWEELKSSIDFSKIK